MNTISVNQKVKAVEDLWEGPRGLASLLFWVKNKSKKGEKLTELAQLHPPVVLGLDPPLKFISGTEVEMSG